MHSTINVSLLPKMTVTEEVNVPQLTNDSIFRVFYPWVVTTATENVLLTGKSEARVWCPEYQSNRTKTKQTTAKKKKTAA